LRVWYLTELNIKAFLTQSQELFLHTMKERAFTSSHRLSRAEDSGDVR